MSMERILVADDDRNIAELLRLYLEKEGYTVTLACDGVDAMEKFIADTPDIVLLDIMMPRLDGWQVCREIRQRSNCPIIMLTAKGETFDKVLGLELGADDYVVKPFSNMELLMRIKAILRRTAGAKEKEKQAEPAVENAENIIAFQDLVLDLRLQLVTSLYCFVRLVLRYISQL